MFKIIGLIIGSLFILSRLFLGGILPFFMVLLGIIIFVFSAVTADRGNLKIIGTGIGTILIGLFIFPLAIIIGWIIMIVGSFLGN